ncbi:CAF17-like 4Fe-4S cluster assembly/insertion protein YgfZ [Pararhizobium haloflavum]|uniref:CAF17-like 4Fe-4S cluster assembly/insertion protein YgfZ n=1 Tax=Pararhizobium haloflavum TaxID=2037914 RepID=UPI000C1A4B73|nr:folate-binding protein YgfZ [Pararhizobium haloflavum]
MPSVALNDRAVVRICGPEAGRLLQDVLTPDLDKLAMNEAVGGALLTPQGKIMFDFVIARDGSDGFLIDLDRAIRDDFIKRMMLYRLRAKVEIAAASDIAVSAAWDEASPAQAHRDRRFRSGADVYRVYGPNASDPQDMLAYDALRISAGVAESGRDYALSDIFPHDVLMDLNGGVSFRKGCFVGQEVVSRMQHRGTARRRLVQVAADEPLPAAGTAVSADGKQLGVLGTVVERSGLAIVRTDRVAAALEREDEISVDGLAVKLMLPEWTGLGFLSATEEA